MSFRQNIKGLSAKVYCLKYFIANGGIQLFDSVIKALKCQPLVTVSIQYIDTINLT